MKGGSERAEPPRGVPAGNAAPDLGELRQRELAAEARRLAAERDAILGQLVEGVIITDPAGRITFVNEAARQLHGVAELGVPVERYSATYHLLTLDGRPYPPEELPLARAVRHGETVRDARWRIRRPDGSQLVAEGSAAPIHAADGARLGSVLVVHDVTAQHELERQKEEFLTVAAHDLNNPLTAIMGTAQLLRRSAARPGGPDPGQLAAGLAAIEAAASRMARLVANLLDLAQPQAGHPLELARGPTDLVALVRQAVAAQQAGTERHRLRVESGEAALVGAWDAARLERVLGNLLGNAIKYSPDGGEIAVTVAREVDAAGAWALVIVRDNGLGIPAGDLSRVFERFHRGANVAGRIGGTGIGLAAARQVIEQHGGQVAVTSREGVGTTVTVRLPLPAGEAGADATIPTSAAGESPVDHT